MRRFIETAFYHRLLNGFTEENFKIQEAYDEFIYYLMTFCKDEQDLILVSLTLNYTKSEFQSLVVKECCSGYVDKCIYMIDAALNVIDLRIHYPKAIGVSQIKSTWQSPLCFADCVGYVDIMEIVSGLFYANTIHTISGGVLNFADVARIFEVGFNFDFADIYKKRDDVFVRKPSKRTEFLNRLIYAINMESKKRGYL